jgi:hypothetical protein
LLALQHCLVAISGKTAASEQHTVSFLIDVLRPCTTKLNRIDRHKAAARSFASLSMQEHRQAHSVLGYQQRMASLLSGFANRLFKGKLPELLCKGSRR